MIGLHPGGSNLSRIRAVSCKLQLLLLLLLVLRGPERRH
jgi:hypothetical protein